MSRLDDYQLKQLLFGQLEIQGLHLSGSVTFKTLKRLLVSSRVDDAALRHLPTSSQLEELALAITQNQLAEYSPLPSDTPLRNAKKLDLCLSGLDLIVNLLRPGDQKFSEITIHLFNLDLPRAIGSVFNGLASRARKSPLQPLCIYSAGLHPGNDDEFYTVSFNTIQPLSFLGTLCELSIQLENPTSLGDEELVEMARGWPLLQVFELCSIRPSPAKWITHKRAVTACCHLPEFAARWLDA